MRSLLSLVWLVAVGCAGAVEPKGLSVGTGGGLERRGVPYRGIGVNYYDAFARALEQPPRLSYEAGFQELAARKIPFARFSAGGYWPWPTAA